MIAKDNTISYYSLHDPKCPATIPKRPAAITLANIPKTTDNHLGQHPQNQRQSPWPTSPKPATITLANLPKTSDNHLGQHPQNHRQSPWPTSPKKQPQSPKPDISFRFCYALDKILMVRFIKFFKESGLLPFVCNKNCTLHFTNYFCIYECPSSKSLCVR
uniref:Uncharacterized protein n=1 Tax=Clytia hemisphaerica TaxID=252671 RepID=A0A7M5X599_9CNID